MIEAELQARGGRLMANAKVQVCRAYEDLAQGDGTRVLVDRIWPRGLTKAVLRERACNKAVKSAVIQA